MSGGNGLAAPLAGLSAGAAWAGLALQMVLMIHTFVASGEGAAAGLWRFFAFFTLLTNSFVAVVATLVVLGRAPHARVLASALVSIVVVGVVYHAVLAPLWDPQGAQLVADVLLHTVTPLAFASYWLFGAPHGRLVWRDAAAALVFPGLYLPYILLRAEIDGFYPYPFINLPEIGWTGLVVNAVALLGVFALLAAAAVAIDRRLS